MHLPDEKSIQFAVHCKWSTFIRKPSRRLTVFKKNKKLNLF